MSDSDRDPADLRFSVRNARWRGWLRVHTPDFLYYRLGAVVPKAEDCQNHEWYNQGNGIDACYPARPPGRRPRMLPGSSIVPIE
jgi:hypothetical protein